MSKQGAILNTFEAGMVRDRLPERQPKGTYFHAMNMMWGSEDHLGVFTQEQSNAKFNVESIPGKIVGVSYFAEIDQSVLFVDNGSSELYLLHHDSGRIEFIMKDSDYGCDWGFGGCEMLYGELKLMECEDRILYFSSDCNYWRVNIDEMLSPRKDCIKDCTHFQLFRCVCAPHVKPIVVDGGGFIRAGAYYVALQLEDNDGNRTNFFPAVGPLYVGSENNIAGEISNKSIRIFVDRMDPGYNKVNIVVIRKIGGVISAEQIVSRPQNGNRFTYDYYGDNPDAVAIDLDEVFVKQSKFFRGSDLIQKDGRLFIYGIKQQFNVNYQKYANQIQPIAVEFEVTAETQQQYNLPTLMRGETYAFVAWLNYCDGTKSKAFHIPHPDATGAAQFSTEGISRADSGATGTYADAQYDTSNVHRTIKLGLGGESTADDDPYTNSVEDNIEAMDCFDEDKAKSAVGKFGEYFGVDELGECLNADLDDASNFIQDQMEETAEFSTDKSPAQILLGRVNSLKEAALDLIKRGVKERERRIFGKVDWSFNRGSRYTPPPLPAEETLPPDGEAATLRDSVPATYRQDNWTNGRGENLLPERPNLINKFHFKSKRSTIPYPDLCDCDGQRMYPEGNIHHHTVPEAPETDHFVSNKVGVSSKYDKANSAWGDSYIRLIGVQFMNVYIPKEDEVPKPLCKNKPISFGIIKRDLNDRTILAKGILTSTFEGPVNGTTHIFPRHGVNSFETVDVAISDGDSKIGTDSSVPAYCFHSLDTMGQKIPLAATKLKVEMELFGSGWRYGLYSIGKKPDMWYTGKRIDNRGARQSVSLMSKTVADEERSIKALTYAPANSVVTPPPGITHPLCNRFRESCVYMELDGKLSLSRGVLPEADASFVGDTLDHSAPVTNAAAWYVSLRRDLPDQYGTVSNQNAVDSGIGVMAYEPGATHNPYGIMGDTIIGLHSIKRSGYVSDKVGDLFPVPNGSTDGRVSSWKRFRSICDSPADFSVQNLGMDHYPTRLPVDGDVNEPMNWAGLHTTDQVADAITASQRTAPDSDYYFPRVQKTLITYFGEFELNSWKRQTGAGSQKVEGKVYFPNLKDLALDPSFGEETYWDDAWLTRFYVEVEQPSKQVLAKKLTVRTLISLILPIIELSAVTSLESIPDTFFTLVALPALSAYFTYAKQTLFTDEWLNRIFGLPVCKTDSAGGEDFVKVVKFEDNYTEVSRDYSAGNEFEVNWTIPDNYNTCVCDDCSDDQTREIYYSNKQKENSSIDSYRSFQANNYSVIPPYAGKLQKLFVESNRFYAHTTDGIWVLQYSNVQAQYDGITAIIGKGDLLADPQQYMEGATEGFLGLIDRNSSISCKHGYIFPARDTGQIVQIFQGQPKIISDAGMKSFFEKQLDFCGQGDCIDEREDMDIVLGYDPKTDRLLVTKRDEEECSSWTVSYNFNSQTWISFHSYIPRFYIWDRSNLFSIKDNDIYLHNAKPWDYLNFYDTQYNGSVDFVTRHESGESFLYMSTLIDSDAQVSNNNDILRGRHYCFSWIALWNRTQGTGLLPIQVRSDNPDTENDVRFRLQDKGDVIDADYANSQWRINDLLDRVKNMNGDVASRDCACTPHVRLNNQGEELPGLANMKDRYLFYRLMISDARNYRMYLNSVITQINMVME